VKQVWMMDSIDAALDLVNLHPLMRASSGHPSIVVGLIDGPVDLSHPAFASQSLRTVSPTHVAMCENAGSGACVHGTAVAGILCARRGVPAPAICPSCTILLRPIFAENSSESRDLPVASPRDLSRAIIETVDAGAKIINLSLGLITSDLAAFPELDDASDYACKRGVILVAASGNQGRIGFMPLLRHPWLIPVASCDATASVTAESNVSPSIGTRGLRAPGVAVTTTAPAARYAQITGTSAAAAFVSGGLALLWSELPHATAAQVRQAALQAAGNVHRSITPPLFDAEGARRLLRSIPTIRREVIMEEGTEAARTTQVAASESPVALQREAKTTARTTPPQVGSAAHMTRGRGRVAAQVGGSSSCPTCAPGAQESGMPATFIYAIGTIKTRFPSPAIEKEFVQSVGEGQTANLTDQQVLYNVLKENRYLANEMCWVFSVEGIDVYVLVARDSLMVDQFVEAVRPATKGLDVDVIIGTRGPMAPPEMCNGLVVPIVVVDRLYSFDRPALVQAIPKPRELTMADAEFQSAAEELFDRIQQVSDNVGATDEHRALNYLAVRYPAIYTHTTEMFARNFSLTAVDVVPSRLGAGPRKLVDVILAYTNRNTDVVEKYYVRVDVTEKYPFLDKKLSPFYDRA
jgi:PatG C-terminal/Subtilase family